ncbi:diguanylate cyclase [Amphritea sp. 1_MG-2023]|nr:diguanylate cyclase [Amphritea sp. 1_MG-2023]
MCVILIGLTITALIAADRVGASLDNILSERIPTSIEILRVAKAADALVSSASPLGFDLSNTEELKAFNDLEKKLNTFKESIDSLDKTQREVSAIHDLAFSLDENVQTLKSIVRQRRGIEALRNQQHDQALLNQQNFQQSLTYRIRILQSDSRVIEHLISQPNPPLSQTVTLIRSVSKAMPIAQFYGAIESLHSKLQVASKAETKIALLHDANILEAILSNSQRYYQDLPSSLVVELEAPFNELHRLIKSDNGVLNLRSKELSLLTEGRIIVQKNQELTKQIELQAEQLVTFGVQTIDEAKIEANNTRNRFFLVMLSISSIGLIGLVFLMYFHIHQYIIARLTWLSQSIQEVAAGNLDIDLPPTGNDELGRLGHALKVFWLKTKETAVREAQLRESNQALHLANCQLSELSVKDSLTGLYNRRRFDEALIQEWNRTGHIQQPISLIMIDIDLFKTYNDVYGHQEGDECLRQVATVLQNSARRASDLVARYGGEEFCIISAYSNLAQAELIAEEIRCNVEALAIKHPSASGGVVTVSVGFVSLIPGQQQTTPDSFLRMADKALYLAKEAGRNCIRSIP